MKLRGRKIAIFVEKMYEDLEFWYPYLRMKEEGADICVVAPKVETYEGKHGLKAKADQSIIGVKTDEFNALIIPGGYSPDHMRRTPEMAEFVKKMNEEKKPIAAICHGPWMLASADIIKGKKVTSFFSIKDDLIHAGAEWIDQEVIKDGNIITSRNPNDLPAFCRKIIETLEK
ncbi:MAG TPA: type 1 glutamine amidotransferase domain-containing protein [Ignavibacteriaceae bacterium]|jgi:protease I|nr:type 1 glutamine amidotransferase domain-containing protein [Ignavibacteriaceae bacterium]